MADLDYGKITVYPGKYDDYMVASTLAREQQSADNAKAKERVADLKGVRRALPRECVQGEPGHVARAADREDQDRGRQALQPAVPVHPLRSSTSARSCTALAVEVQKMAKGFDKVLFSNVNFRIDAGEKVAIIGPNGIGKTTLLRCLAGDLAPDTGTIKWAEKARLGYYAQDHAADFAEDKLLMDWMTDWRGPNDDDQVVRATLGRLLFSGDDVKKKVKVLSGGEKGRMLFGKLMLQRPTCC